MQLPQPCISADRLRDKHYNMLLPSPITSLTIGGSCALMVGALPALMSACGPIDSLNSPLYLEV